MIYEVLSTKINKPFEMEQKVMARCIGIALFLSINASLTYATSKKQCIFYCPKDCNKNEDNEKDFIFSCSTAKHNCDCNANPPYPVRGPFADKAKDDKITMILIIIAAVVGVILILAGIGYLLFILLILRNRRREVFNPAGYNNYAPA